MDDEAETNEHTCEVCGRTFASAEELDQHVREVGLAE
jgi:hypothetical protein